MPEEHVRVWKIGENHSRAGKINLLVIWTEPTRVAVGSAPYSTCNVDP
jgi:hypothetical protein